MSLAVIIPVYNDAARLAECLTAVVNSTRVPDELIVVDDASTDSSAEVASSFGARVLRSSVTAGPASCRNIAFESTDCQLIVFLDADTRVHSDTIEGLEKRLLADAGLAAVIGSYDNRPEATGCVSQFRNLSHHFVHGKASTKALTFWSGCGIVRREVLLKSGGFDARFRRPSVEDIELGYRLSAKGERILLDPTLQVTHLKLWTLRNAIRTDIFYRGAPWFRLLLERGNFPNDLNVTAKHRLSTALTALGCLSMLLSLWTHELLLAAVVSFGFAVFLHLDLLRYLARRRGLRFLFAAVPLLLLQQMCNLAAVAIGSADYLIHRYSKRTLPVHALFEKAQQGSCVFFAISSENDHGSL